jgi:hypothetical protein
MNHNIARVGALVALVVAWSGNACAATITSNVDSNGSHYVTLDGPIERGDPDRFAAIISEANARGYRLESLLLNSPGGYFWEAMAMAVMVRWVKEMATVVQKNATCESSCFGLFAAGYRKYLDPAGDPTQIGVHSIYAIIKQQGGGSTLFWKEKGDTTIWAVRRLKEIDVPPSIVDSIVTTPPDRMTYLTIAQLKQMGVEVAGYPAAADQSGRVMMDKSNVDTIFLSPAMARADIKLDNGTIIPSGTIVVTIDDWKDARSLDEIASHLCVPDREHRGLGVDAANRTCTISYHLFDAEISTARVPESSLITIQQGFF